MSLITGAFLCVILILVITQIYFGFFHTSKENNGQNEYPEDVLVHGNAAMDAVRHGKIKMHILENDAEKFNSATARESYVHFIDKSPLFRKVSEIKGSNYHG